MGQSNAKKKRESERRSGGGDDLLSPSNSTESGELSSSSFVSVHSTSNNENKANTASDDDPSSKSPRRKKVVVAVVGGGVTGLACAWHLTTNYNDYCFEVHLIEKQSHLGGHARTVSVATEDGTNSEVQVDTGFMVYNYDNYPNLVEWFRALGVESENSDMSLSVSLDGGREIEWSSDGLRGLLGGADWRQIFRPQFYRFFRDMLRFNREASAILLLNDDDPRKHITTADYLRQKQLLRVFCRVLSVAHGGGIVECQFK